MTVEQLTQLGVPAISAIFIFACVQLFTKLQASNDSFLKYLIEQNAELRKQNTQLAEQNKLLAIALFSNNQDAMRAYNALNKTSNNSSSGVSIPLATDLMDK